MAALLIGRVEERERAQMLAAIHGRADSLVWALEGSARFLDGRHTGAGGLERLVAEVARQPGVAWIAITDAAGRILADSNPELAGAALYTPEEMRRLAPGTVTRGRFSPDDPSVYETWRLFAPARLRGAPGRHGRAGLSRPAGEGLGCVFVALDVTGMEDHLAELALQLWIMAGIVLVAAEAVAALVLLFRRYRSSRRLLADAEALAAQVVRNYPAGLLVLDRAGKVRLSNARARALLGMEGEAASLPRDAAAGLELDALLAELAGGAELICRELELWRPKGDPVPVELTAARLYGSQGGGKAHGGAEVLGYLFALRDMGEIRGLERKLRQHERLSALGKLAAGLAHEIRNPLSSVRGYATYLTERLRNDPLGHATGELLIEETARLDRVLADLLSLARPRDLAPGPVHLGDVLSRVVAVAAPDAAAKGVRLAAVLPEGGGDVASVDADRLMQAVLNLVINAIQATDAGGEVEVALEPAPKQGEDAASDAASPGWRIRVRDTGCGMARETAAQIFTPYFTTRATGTGLGLAIARQIVEQHGGAISVSTLPGHGTTMTIELPGAAAPRARGGAA
ncbi:ATP-binding protein [Desulfovibrio sp.]|uniref:ATP-binding protein n=1 Tax=Desulfovibrio sp. TaxID=885 RepID=UPI0023CEEDA1|nr:ATP-binding protein [Desulfovibrio sp.]MDE7241558.1 PAS domain-containing sensor histidine kinase [Desulfovibrio sp.]